MDYCKERDIISTFYKTIDFSNLQFGFECNEGWYKLLLELFTQIYYICNISKNFKFIKRDKK